MTKSKINAVPKSKKLFILACKTDFSYPWSRLFVKDVNKQYLHFFIGGVLNFDASMSFFSLFSEMVQVWSGVCTESYFCSRENQGLHILCTFVIQHRQTSLE